MLLSCFETRSRLQKIISRGRARKNEDDSRREFPGSRILADLWYKPLTLDVEKKNIGGSFRTDNIILKT